MSEGSHRSAPASAGPEGIGLVVPHAAVLLPAGVGSGAVARVWDILAGSDVQAESLVAVLPLRGDAEVPSFGIAVHDGDGPDGARLQVVLRGDAVIDVAADGGIRRIDARGAVPFYLATLDRVAAYRLGRTADAVAADVLDALPILAGAVVCGQVAWSRLAGDAPPSGRRRRGAHARPDAEAAAPAEAQEPAHAVPPTTAPAPAPAPASAPATAPAPAPAVSEASARARSAAAPTAAIPTAPADDGDLSSLPVHAFRIVPADPARRSDPEGPADAERIPLDVPAVVGRRPRPPRVVRGAAPRLVAVASPLGEISGTHVGIRQEGGAVVVTDLDSTNGTAVLVPGAERLALHRGESLVVVPGTRVDIGDGVVLEILPAR
ncbi:FHA domain-containing protein [Clavibacter sp. Sh2126]|uniref:FHA domain-containing protein n=1 Tax=Clavibacter sp. Sh2126 TaxID=3397678 RepID=UPI0039E16DD0